MFFSDIETLLSAPFYLLCKHRIKKWDKEDIKKYQQKKISNIVKFAFNHSPFYRSHYKNINLSDFASLPPVNKQLMMDNFSDFNTLGLPKDELIKFALECENKRDFSTRFRSLAIGMSSGTSGNKGIIITTPREEHYLKAMYISRLVLPKQKLNCAFILRVSSPVFNFSLFGNKLTYINQLQTIDQIISQIGKIQPNVISAPPSMLKILAEEKDQGRFNVNPVLIYSYAEVLYPDVRGYIEGVFKCPIHQIYQGSEGCYALTCRKGNLHINEDIVFLELLNQDNSPTPPGNPCFRLLVTDLHKHSQPVIRYELNDILTISPNKCSCGSNFGVIESIQGRADQMFWGLRNKTHQKQFIFPDYIARKIISMSEDILDFQVIQNDYFNVQVIVKLKLKTHAENIIDQIQGGIRNIFQDYDCDEPNVSVKIGEPQRNSQSNKLIRIICNIKEDKQ